MDGEYEKEIYIYLLVRCKDTMFNHYSFTVTLHWFYKCLKVYWMDATPLFQKTYPHLMMVMENAVENINSKLPICETGLKQQR